MRNRNLRKRSTYLVINLAVIDMFVGGPVVIYLFFWPGVLCNLWKWFSIEHGTNIFRSVLTSFFPIASLTNITIIALERGARYFLRVQASRASKMGLSIYNCQCLDYFWDVSNMLSSFAKF